MNRLRQSRLFVSIGRAAFAAACAMIAVGVVAGQAGCEMVAYPFTAMESRKIAATYKIPNRKTVVLIDDPHRQFSDSAVVHRMAEVVAFHLKEDGAVNDVVPHEQVMDLAEREGEQFARMSIQDVGEALGAQQVIQVEIRQVIMTTEPGIQRPTGSAWVKVWDVAAKQRAFPTDNADGTKAFLANVQMRYQRDEARTSGARYVLVREFADYFGEEIAGLFYNRKKPPPGAMAKELQ